MPLKSTFRATVVASLLLLAGAQILFAQQPVQPINLRQLVDQADIVFVGKCVATRSRWDDALRIILTDSTFEVVDYLKGGGETRITITELGGALPERNLGMMVPGMAQFREDEEVVLFVRAVNELNRVVGGARGKYSIDTQRGTGAKSVGRKPLASFLADLHGMISQRPQPDGY